MSGREHTALGEVATSTLPGRVALGITRGLHRKRWRYLDPNEDTVAARVASASTLLVVADAHNGHTAADVAVTYLLDHIHQDAALSDLDQTRLVELFHGVNEAVLSVTRGRADARADSRTTLVLAVLGPPDAAGGRDLVYGALGDSSLILAGRDGGSELTVPHHQFVGAPMSRYEVAGRLQHGRVQLPAGTWTVVISDGFTEFVGRSAAAGVVAEHLPDDGTPERFVRALIDQAGAAGAGDNVAVAVAGPQEV